MDYPVARRCALCPGSSRTCIQPNGPLVPGRPLFIGEAPGYEENNKGIPLVGKTGKEVNEHYMPLAGFRRDDSDVCCAINCYPDRPKGKLNMQREKDRQLVECCASTNLYPLIQYLKPSILVPMGAFACYAIDPDINLEFQHGIPLQTNRGMVFPMYNPGQGIHEPKKMLLIRNDWVRLRRHMRGMLRIPVDAYPNPDYAEATVSDVDNIDVTLPMASDTEWSRSRGPYFITWSQRAGHARLIKAENTALLVKFQEKLDKWKSYIYFHNWPYDWSVTEDMGLTFPTKMSVASAMGLKFPFPMTRDTMMMAFHLGNLPQGLKALSYRLLGMEMEDFEDLVKPYSIRRVYDYYDAARKLEWTKPDPELVIDDKTGKWKLYQPHSLGTKLKILFTALGKNPDKNLFDVWATWEKHQAELEERVGPYIGMDIADVPFDEAAYYACRDSDADIRLVPIFNRMKEIAMTGKLQEQWDGT